jgi:predicted signal transduction protein with EAL and GGDEF domain
VVSGFGTGYSAPSYLRRCPIELLKIAQSYVARLGWDAEDETIVRAKARRGAVVTANRHGERSVQGNVGEEEGDAQLARRG